MGWTLNISAAEEFFSARRLDKRTNVFAQHEKEGLTSQHEERERSASLGKLWRANKFALSEYACCSAALYMDW